MPARPTTRRSPRALIGALAGLLLALPAAAEHVASAETADVAPSDARAPLPAAEIAAVPVAGAGALGGSVDMHTLVYKPPGDGPFPVLLFSHGRAGSAVERAKLARPIPADQVRFWLARGFAVVAPVRPGYGRTGGVDRESSGTRYEQDGRCSSQPDFPAVVRSAARSVLATLAWLRGQRWADTGRVVLEGQSVGGLTTVAAAAAQPPGVVAYINFAGGAGGDPQRAPGHSCDPAQLGAIYAALGRTTTVPNLWIYAANDQYWGADAPRAWHAGFAAGGSPTRFIAAPAVGDGDGHGLIRHPAALWAGDLDAFLRGLGLPAAR